MAFSIDDLDASQELCAFGVLLFKTGILFIIPLLTCQSLRGNYALFEISLESNDFAF